MKLCEKELKNWRENNMSDDITQQYLEARYEHYLDTGLDPKDAYTNAMQDADEYQVDLSEEWKEEEETNE
jgi:hypothetical protein